MRQVLNYHDAVVYDIDVCLFDHGGWLNDNCINWFFRVLEHDEFPGRPELLFMDPAVVSCMMNQCDDAEEFENMGKGLELEKRRMVFIPVNNASGRLSRGSHWSLLVFERRDADVPTPSSAGSSSSSVMRFRHFDSCDGSNSETAERTAENFLRMFDGSKVGHNSPVPFEDARDAPQQSNAFDCGMYTVLLAERLASKAPTATPAEAEAAAAAVKQSAGRAADALLVAAPEGVAEKTAVAEEPREKDRTRQGTEAGFGRRGIDVASDGAISGSGGGGGLADLGGGREGTAVAVEGVSASAEMISPEFVSSARALARERLDRCIRIQGWC